MKYTDQQRIEKMLTVTEKLLDYLSANHITTAEQQEIMARNPEATFLESYLESISFSIDLLIVGFHIMQCIEIVVIERK